MTATHICIQSAAAVDTKDQTGDHSLDHATPRDTTVKISLKFDVSYDLKGTSPQYMVALLIAMCERAIGEGGLTGSTEAEVEEYSVNALVQH